VEASEPGLNRLEVVVGAVYAAAWAAVPASIVWNMKKFHALLPSWVQDVEQVLHFGLVPPALATFLSISLFAFVVHLLVASRRFPRHSLSDGAKSRLEWVTLTSLLVAVLVQTF
jgi:hypothetical protein